MYSLDGRQLHIAKSIGEPISPVLPVPVELDEICNTETAKPGEKVWRYTATDTTADIIYEVNADGSIDAVKRSPTGDAELTFQGLSSKKEYVLIDDILAESDNVSVLARRKASITQGMDKKEVYAIIRAIQGSTALGQANSNFVPGVACQSVAVASGDDLYDVLVKMKHAVENYGDDLLLLEGTDVKEAIDTYDKDNVASFNYNIKLKEQIANWDMKELKIFGDFKDKVGASHNIMDAKKLVMVARNSRIQAGKPITFVRRLITPEMAQHIGADPDNAQRIVLSSEAPQSIAGTDTFGYSVWGYESIIFLITNPYAIVTCDLTSLV